MSKISLINWIQTDSKKYLLQIKEFRIMSLSINDSVYSCLFFFLTGLHFFHLLVGLLLLSLLFWRCSFNHRDPALFLIFFWDLLFVFNLMQVPQVNDCYIHNFLAVFLYFRNPSVYRIYEPDLNAEIVLFLSRPWWRWSSFYLLWGSYNNMLKHKLINAWSKSKTQAV